MILLYLLLVPIGAILFLYIILSPAAPLPASLVPKPAPRPAPFLAELRARLEKLYFDKRITLDVMNELIGVIEGKPVANPTPEARPVHDSEEERRYLPRVSAGNPTPNFRAAVSLTQSPETDQTSNIKLMLLSGAALVVLASYLFVRSYWSVIPDAMKFGALMVATVGVYVAGRILWAKKRIPQTAETLVGIGIASLLFCEYAFNVLILPSPMPVSQAWMVGFILVAVGAAFTAPAISTTSIGLLFGVGIMGALQAAQAAFHWSAQEGFMTSALGSFALVGCAAAISWPACKRALLWVANAGASLLALSLVFQGFFWHQTGLLPAVLGLIALAGSFIFQSRMDEPLMAYPAGLSLLGALALLLHHLGVPTYQFGLYFIPAAMLAVLRAWLFKKQGQPELADPYLHLSQVAMMGSLVCVSRLFVDPQNFSFPLAAATLLLAAGGYAVMGSLYRSPAFTYATMGSLLYLAGVYIFHFNVSFDSALLLLATLGMGLSLVSLALPSKLDEQVNTPVVLGGMGLLTLTLFGLAGRWVDIWWLKGAVGTIVPPAQLNAGLWVAGLGVVGYIVMAIVQKQAMLVYPALGSLSLFFLLVLQKLGMPIDSWHVSWIIPASTAFYWVFNLRGNRSIARCFAVWSEIVFIFVALGIFAGKATDDAPTLWLCLVSFAPSLFFGETDQISCAVASIYLLHLVIFGKSHEQDLHKTGAYALQLVAVNSGVVFIRTLLTSYRPKIDVTPLRVAAAFFAALSLALSLTDRNVGWQVFLAHGILGIAVSLVLYEGRYIAIGATLMLAAYELFLWHIHVHSVEAYWMPAGLYALIWGYVRRQYTERDLLYIVAQLALYVPSFMASLGTPWGEHGIYVGAAALGVMLFGVQFRQRVLVMGGSSMLLLNGLVQSREVLRAIPRWFMLAASGGMLVTLGAIFEFHREWIDSLNRRLKQAYNTLS